LSNKKTIPLPPPPRKPHHIVPNGPQRNTEGEGGDYKTRWGRKGDPKRNGLTAKKTDLERGLPILKKKKKAFSSPKGPALDGERKKYPESKQESWRNHAPTTKGD